GRAGGGAVRVPPTRGRGAATEAVRGVVLRRPGGGAAGARRCPGRRARPGPGPGPGGGGRARAGSAARPDGGRRGRLRAGRVAYRPGRGPGPAAPAPRPGGRRGGGVVLLAAARPV